KLWTVLKRRKQFGRQATTMHCYAGILALESSNETGSFRARKKSQLNFRWSSCSRFAVQSVSPMRVANGVHHSTPAQPFRSDAKYSICFILPAPPEGGRSSISSSAGTV